MRKKIFLLPGFGEDAFCFNELRPFLGEYNLIDVDYRPVLNKFVYPMITPTQFAKKLIQHYAIQKQDLLIGHSMGGYFSYYIRHLQGNEICMIGAFNDATKIIHSFPSNPRMTTLLVLSGAIKTNYIRDYVSKRNKDPKIKSIVEHVMHNMKRFNNLQLGLMNEMCYTKLLRSDLPNPLRIHDIKDRVVSPPDEKYHQVEGGHFCLILYPKDCIALMHQEGFLS